MKAKRQNLAKAFVGCDAFAHPEEALALRESTLSS